jgi:hypothetical protein
MNSRWSSAYHSARRIAGLLKGGWRKFIRTMQTKPVGSSTRVVTPRARRSSGNWS